MLRQKTCFHDQEENALSLLHKEVKSVFCCLFSCFHVHFLVSLLDCFFVFI